MKLSFDHAYAQFFSAQAYLELASLGFSVFPDQIVEHEATQFCRFLKFDGAYLEFVEVKNRQEYEIWVDINGHESSSPGLSFRSDGDLKVLYEIHEDRFKQNGIALTHKNYDWKKDSKSRLPGWNFIEFKESPLRGINLFFIEYEKRPQSNLLSTPIHKNQTKSVLGVVLDLDADEQMNIELLTGAKSRGGVALLEGGFTLHYSGPKELSSKSIPFRAVILGADNLKTFDSGDSRLSRIRWGGREFFHIPMPPNAFDLLVTEIR